MERNRKAGQNPPRVVATIEEEEEDDEDDTFLTYITHNYAVCCLCLYYAL